MRDLGRCRFFILSPKKETANLILSSSYPDLMGDHQETADFHFTLMISYSTIPTHLSPRFDDSPRSRLPLAFSFNRSASFHSLSLRLPRLSNSISAPITGSTRTATIQIGKLTHTHTRTHAGAHSHPFPHSLACPASSLPLRGDNLMSHFSPLCSSSFMPQLPPPPVWKLTFFSFRYASCWRRVVVGW